MEVTDQVSLTISSFKGDAWVHIRRKDKSISLSSTDFEKILKKKNEIRLIIEETIHDIRGNEKKRKREESSSPSYRYNESF